MSKLAEQCAIIEECYEYMLAYAGQGVSGEEGGSQMRDFLNRAAGAISGLESAYEEAIKQDDLQPVERYRGFLKVLSRDAGDSLASIELVLAQPRISSQLIDNLNANIHLRALLTGLFLIDEILKTRQVTENQANTA